MDDETLRVPSSPPLGIWLVLPQTLRIFFMHTLGLQQQLGLLIRTQPSAPCGGFCIATKKPRRGEEIIIHFAEFLRRSRTYSEPRTNEVNIKKIIMKPVASRFMRKASCLTCLAITYILYNLTDVQAGVREKSPFFLPFPLISSDFLLYRKVFIQFKLLLRRQHSFVAKRSTTGCHVTSTPE
jgi:hypothetical protein